MYQELSIEECFKIPKLFKQKKLDQKAVVLHGLAGVGKTRVLQMLSKRNVSVLDLESIAAHRVENC